MKNYFLLLLVTLATCSCSECDECEVLRREPSITLELVNQSTLANANNNLAQLNIEITANGSKLNTVNQQLVQNQDRVNALEAAIVAGDSSLMPQLEAARNAVNALVKERNEVSNLLGSQNAQKTALQSFLSRFNSRRTRIDTLYNLDNGRYITFADSSSTFKIPLATAAPSTNLMVVMGTKRLRIRMDYDLEVFENEKSFVGLNAKNVVIATHSFDSVRVDCRGICRSEDAKVVAFY